MLGNIILTFIAFFQTIAAIFNIYQRGFLWFINKHKIKEIDIGELIYDEYIRYNKSFLNPSAFDIKLFLIIFRSFFRVLSISKTFDRSEIDQGPDIT